MARGRRNASASKGSPAILSEAELDAVISKIDSILDRTAPAKTASLNSLGDTVYAYESVHHHPSPDLPSGELLLHLLQIHGLSASQLAIHAGVSPDSITSALAGTKSLKGDEAKKVAAFFSLEPTAFVDAKVKKRQTTAKM